MRSVWLLALGAMVFVALVFVAATTAVRAQAPSLSCSGSRQVKRVAELLFGRDIGDKVAVSGGAWTRFVARQVTPRFPDGLTVTDAVGQWRDPRGGIVREPSKRVEIILPGNADDDARLDAVVKAYKREFRQHSVVVLLRPACVSF